MNKYTLLIVENDKETEQLIMELLSGLDTTCYTTDNGKEALQIIEDNRGTQFDPEYLDAFFTYIYDKEGMCV